MSYFRTEHYFVSSIKCNNCSELCFLTAQKCCSYGCGCRTRCVKPVMNKPGINTTYTQNLNLHQLICCEIIIIHSIMFVDIVDYLS